MTDGGFRSRKWIGFLIFVIVPTGLLLVDKLTGQQWVDVSVWAFGIFAGANVASKFPSTRLKNGD